ncbi:MAG: LUD domain-containing protein [Chloroflexota bacterium]
MTTRDQFLARIRTSLKSANLPSSQFDLPRRELSHLSTDSAALAESFTRELTALACEVYQPQNDEEAIEIVLKIINDSNAYDVLTWDESELPLRGLLDALTRVGIKRSNINLSNEVTKRKAQTLELDAPLVGITGALAGLADTGSLALLSAPTRSRAASLTPLTHIALLRINNLYPDMASFLTAHPDITQDSSNLIFITGPSRTADIEFTLVRGVHGPKFVHVVLLK